MSDLKRWLGLDLFDLIVHAGVTICLMGFIGVTGGPDELYPMVTAASLVVLAIRRKFGLARAARITAADAERLAEVEDRVAYLEGLQDRVLEMEERLDFAERMLAKQESPKLPGPV